MHSFTYGSLSRGEGLHPHLPPPVFPQRQKLFFNLLLPPGPTQPWQLLLVAAEGSASCSAPPIFHGPTKITETANVRAGRVPAWILQMRKGTRSITSRPRSYRPWRASTCPCRRAKPGRKAGSSKVRAKQMTLPPERHSQGQTHSLRAGPGAKHHIWGQTVFQLLQKCTLDFPA